MRIPPAPALVLLLVPLLLLAPAPASAGDAPTLAYEKYQLPNGLTVILHEDARLPEATVNVWYHVGTREEPPGRSGFAHLFEHLMFMGTKRVPGNGFDIKMESGGGANNASTWFDRTNYFSWGPARLLPTLLWLEADRMEGLGAAMTQEKLDLQREVVRNERREGYDNAPYGPSEYLFWQFMFPTDHPYHFHVIGSHEDLLAATVEDVVQFFDTYYIPNNATLVVAGAFDGKQVKPLIEGLFGSIPRGDEPPRRSAPPVGFERVERVTLPDQVQFPRLTVAWHSPAFYRPGDAEMDLIAFALGSGKNGRLYRKLVRDEQVAMDVSVEQTSLRLGSVLRVDCYVKPGVDLDKAERMLFDELRAFTDTGPTPQELERGRADVERSAWSELESLSDVADRLNHYDDYLGTPDGVALDLARYARATPEGVRDWARKVLRPDRCLVMRVVPEVPADPNLPGRDVQPPPMEQAAFAPPVPETFELPSGLRVWHVRRPGLPLVQAVLQLPGGTSAVPRAQAGTAELAAEMLLEGAGERDGVAFADALDLLGASLQATAGTETTQVSLRVLQRNADAAFGLLADALRRTRFDDEAFARQRDLLLDDLQGQLDDPAALARRVGGDAYHAAEDPFGTPHGGYPATVAALTRDAVRGWHERFHGPQGAVLLTAGDLELAQVRALVAKHLGSWTQAQPRPEPAASPARPAGALRVVLVDRPGAAQTVVRFLHPGPDLRAPERVPLQVLNALFGGSFTSRLNANLRETHGYTYGASSGFTFLQHEGLFVAAANVETDKTGPSLREFLAEFARARAGGILPEEAQKARETVRGETVRAFETLAGTLGSYAGFASAGMSPQEVARGLEQAAAQTPATLDALAREWIARPGGVLVLVGDREAVAPQLEGLGLPAPTVVTPEDALDGRLGR